MPVFSLVWIRVWHGDYHRLLHCKLVYSSTILGRKACIDMKLIKYMGNDEVKKPCCQKIMSSGWLCVLGTNMSVSWQWTVI